MPELSFEELVAFIERQNDEAGREADRALQLLYGELPAWFPLPRLEHARRIVCQLGNKGFTAEQIAKFVDDEISGNEISYLAVRLDINELAHIKYALSLPDNECLERLAGALAAFAVPFKKHSGTPRKSSAIRKAITRELANDPTLMPRELWAILASKPPKGFAFFENSLGKYIEIEGRRDMGWSRFSRACKEEKDKLNA